ncbi:MAG: (cytosine-5)-methyltransferase 1 [Acidimicrobiaceae bacterium]|nr:(cytosine-5)-methyltransferase 1 [Acidimicrobiaceae bacterium]
MPVEVPEESTAPESDPTTVDDVPPKRPKPQPPLRAAEFFAGIGLVRSALSEAGVEVAWANDIEPIKAQMYGANFGLEHYVLGDVREVTGDDLPPVDLATASFPCTDLSLAGWRRGLAGEDSGMFWEFARVLDEMATRRPAAVLLENVSGFATSHGGRDMHDVVQRLNELGYSCDVFQVDAKHFVPQSRPRLFIVGTTTPVGDHPFWPDALRPQYLVDFATRNPLLDLHAFPLHLPAPDTRTLADVVERVPPESDMWWDDDRSQRFIDSLSPLQAERLRQLQHGETTWRTAYRRTRNGVAVWEIRADSISGCLRTARGGSSKQALVEAGGGRVAVRWMTGREYARLQGVPDDFDLGGLSRNKAMFGFGDAVCVPVVAWIARSYLLPVLRGQAQICAEAG